MGETTYQNMVALYDAYLADSVREVVEGETYMIWKGSILDFSNKLGLTVGTHNRTIKLLKSSGCIQQLQQGSVAAPSVLALLRRPSPEDSIEQDLTPRGRPGKLLPRLDAIEKQLGGVDVVRALVAINDRLETVEAAMTELLQGQIHSNRTKSHNDL